MDAMLAEIEAWVIYVIGLISDYVAQIANNIGGWVTNLIDQVWAWVAWLHKSLLDAFNALVARMVTVFNSILTSIATSLENLWVKILEVTTVVVDRIRAYVAKILAEIRVAVSWLLDTVGHWMVAAITAVMDLAKKGIKAVEEFVGISVQDVKEGIARLVQKAKEVYDSILERIKEALDNMLMAPEAIIETVAKKLVALRESFAEAATTLVQGLSGIDESTFQPIRDSIKDMVKSLVQYSNPVESDAMLREMLSITSGEQSMQNYREFFRQGWSKMAPRGTIWASILASIAIVAAAIPVLLQLSSMTAQPIIQEFAKEFPYQILSPQDVIASWRRGDVSRERAVETIRRLGYSLDDSNLMLQTSDLAPAPADVLSMWHRDLIGESTVDKALHQSGYDPDWQRAIKEASFPIPPVQDLISMAVREVFTPAIVERFGQMEDFPEAFGTWAQRQGLTLEWAQSYWAAHWALPSPRQGFEMLHRGIIFEDDLKMLLRALDVMPFWRQHLVDVAYSPYTRVDVRRMHKIGLLTPAQVTRAYQDLGYDVSKAEGLTEFTIALNKPAKLDDDLELGLLSRTSILGFYEDGLLPVDRARKLLETLGYTPEAAQLYLHSVDSTGERSERKAATDQVLEMAEAGTLTFKEAQDQLSALGLETAEVEKATTRLLRIQQRRTKIPTRAEGESMMLAGVIPGTEYQELLVRLGYSPKWVRAYQSLAAGKARGRQKPS